MAGKSDEGRYSPKDERSRNELQQQKKKKKDSLFYTPLFSFFGQFYDILFHI